jgi:hypothetical protein
MSEITDLYRWNPTSFPIYPLLCNTIQHNLSNKPQNYREFSLLAASLDRLMTVVVIVVELAQNRKGSDLQSSRLSLQELRTPPNSGRIQLYTKETLCM